jgi:addiction module HigA family antidote
MIRSWRTSVTRKVWEGERPNQLRGLDFEAAVDLLLALNVAKALSDLSPLKSVGLLQAEGRAQEAVGDDSERVLAHLLRVSQGRSLRGGNRRLPQRVRTMPPAIHPGRLLKRELDARKLSANRLALDIGVPSGRITDILNSRRSITADTAVRLGRYFGNSAQFWLDLQSQYDIAVVERESGAEIARRVRPADAA